MTTRILLASAILIATARSCLQQNFMGVCEQCHTGSLLFEDQTCRRAIPAQGCWVHTLGPERAECVVCRPGFHLSNGTSCQANMPYCTQQKDSTCQQCQDGYILKGGQCLSRQPSVLVKQSHCETFGSNATCRSCQRGYSLNDGRCTPELICNKTLLFQGCALYSGNKCTACLSSYRLSDRGRCIASQVDNCLLDKNGSCQECDILYWPAEGKCVRRQSSIPHCLSQSPLGGCQACSVMYELVNSSCTATAQRLVLKGYILYFISEATNYTIEQEYSSCLETKGGVCIKCHSSYTLDQTSKCRRNLNELSRLRQTTTVFSTSDSPNKLQRNFTYWRPSRGSWLMMRSSEVYRYWGIQLRPKPSMTMSLISVIVSYESEPHKIVCYRNCEPLILVAVGGTYQFTFHQAIITSAIRIVLAKWTGEACFQFDAFFSSVVLQDSKLRPAYEAAEVVASGALTNSQQYLRTSLRFEGSGYRLSSNSSLQQYVGYKCRSGVMRIRQVSLQIGTEDEWVTEFVLKYSMDGIKFYCVDSCNPYVLAGGSRTVVQFEIVTAVYAKYLVLVPKKWHGWPTLRVDFYYDQLISIANCQQYTSAGKCSRCDSNYSNTNGKCRLMVVGCQSVDQFDGKCLQCLQQYYLRKNNSCELRKPGCNYYNDLCSSCVEGYALQAGQCLIRQESMHRMSEISKVIASTRNHTSKLLFANDCAGKGGWLPQSTTNGWVGLQSKRILQLFYMEVSPGALGYLETFYMRYSLDNANYFNFTLAQYFVANSEQNQQLVRIYFARPLEVKSIRIHPLTWKRLLNFNFEFYYYEQAGAEWERTRKGLFSDVGDLMFSRRVAIFEMNPRISENGSFTLPSQAGNWMGFSTDEDKKKRVTLTKLFIRGSELKNSWVERFYLMFSRQYGRKFECYQNCTQIPTNLTDTKAIASYQLTGLENITDIRLFPTAYKGVKSTRFDFQIA